VTRLGIGAPRPLYGRPVSRQLLGGYTRVTSQESSGSAVETSPWGGSWARPGLFAGLAASRAAQIGRRAVTLVALAEKRHDVVVGHDLTVEQVVDLAVGEAPAQVVAGDTPEWTVDRG
jgi:hypothetical protein